MLTPFFFYKDSQPSPGVYVAPAKLQMVAPNPLYGPLMNLVAINIGNPIVLLNQALQTCVAAHVFQTQMVAPNPLYGPLMNLVAINISDPAPAPGFNWYNENATKEVRTKHQVQLLCAMAGVVLLGVQPCPCCCKTQLIQQRRGGRRHALSRHQ